MNARPAILATGSSVPATVRTNDDPVFDWLRSHPGPLGSGLFDGYTDRRVLGPGESIVDHMVTSAQQALTGASVAAGDIDLLVGYCSVSEWEMPNDLAVVASRLGLPSTALVVPVNCEYANFNQSLLLADALLSAGRAQRALVVIGANWTKYMDYTTAPSLSAGDGAGAAVMALSADPTRFAVVDHAVDSDAQYLGGMYLSADPTSPPAVPPTFHPPVFHLNQEGAKAFGTFGEHRPPSLVQEVLARNGLTAADIAFVGHQTSKLLNDAWIGALAPGQFIETLQTFANMTSASIPVNFSFCGPQITKAHVTLVALGPEPSCNVVLLGREVPAGT